MLSAKHHRFFPDQKTLLPKPIKQNDGLHPLLRALRMVHEHFNASLQVLEVHD